MNSLMMALGKVRNPLSKSVKLALPTTCTIIFCFFLTSCGGDGGEYVIPPQPSPIPIVDPIPEPTPIPELIPEPIPAPLDCCPDKTKALLCSQCTPEKHCLTEYPDVSVWCSGALYTKPYWYLQIGWGLVLIKLNDPDLSCCPLMKTGITYQECNRSKMCKTYYATNQLEWFVYGESDGTWWLHNTNESRSYKVIHE